MLPNDEGVSAKLFEEATFQKMALDIEGVVNGGVDRQETLRSPGRFEPLLFSFPSSHRLV